MPPGKHRWGGQTVDWNEMFFSLLIDRTLSHAVPFEVSQSRFPDCICFYFKSLEWRLVVHYVLTTFWYPLKMETQRRCVATCLPAIKMILSGFNLIQKRDMLGNKALTTLAGIWWFLLDNIACTTCVNYNLNLWVLSYSHLAVRRRSRTPGGCSWRRMSWSLLGKSCWGTSGCVQWTLDLGEGTQQF